MGVRVWSPGIPVASARQRHTGNMMQRDKTRIAVVTDSVACIPPALAQELEIQVIPMQLTLGGKVYLDGVDLTPTEFYRRFREGTALPTTSQPSLGSFARLYARVAQEVDGIVSIHVAERLSATLDTARLAAEQASPVPIQIVDSGTATAAEGFIALAAARAARSGGDLEEVVSVAEHHRNRVGFFCTLATLEHLGRGGRIGQAAALLASRLRICPIIHLAEQEVRVSGVARTRKRALQRVMDLLAERVGSVPIRASVFHADAAEEADWMAQQVQERCRCVEFFMSEFTPVMGAHTGPGVVGIAFCVE